MTYLRVFVNRQRDKQTEKNSITEATLIPWIAGLSEPITHYTNIVELYNTHSTIHAHVALIYYEFP